MSPAAGSPLVATPLASHSGPRGATMFASLPATQTGLVTENRYADPKMWGEHYQEFAYGAIGTGIAIGDFDRDGRPDLFVVSKTERSRLFRNLGDWRFEDVTDRAGLTPDAATPPFDDLEHWRQGATFVDVDNDGWLDLYVCRLNAPNLLFINQHDGTFKEQAAARGLALNDASGMAAFADYDRDGSLDVYIQTNLLDATGHPSGQRDHLFHNNGDGTFTDVTDRAGLLGPNQAHSATWWDYDGDGWPDLYVANDFAVPDFLYHNNRDGTFTDVLDRVVPHTPHSSMGADFGDVNNDGRIDFLVADMAATSAMKDQRGMARIRSLLRDTDTPANVAQQIMRSALYLNTGTGRMLEAAQLAGVEATDWTWSPRFEDLDNDGRLDLHVTNGMVRELHNIDLRNRISASVNPHDDARLMKASPVLTESNLAFRNLGDLQFESVGAAWGLDQRGVSFGSAFGDLDGDGDLDLIYANYQGGVTVLRNDSDTGHRLVVALQGTRSNRFGVGATVRILTAHGPQVRTLVLARGCLSSSEPILHFGLGDDTTIEELTVEWPSGHHQTFHKLAADQKLTITEPDTPASIAQPAPPTPALFEEVGQARGLAFTSTERPFRETQQALLPFRLNPCGPALAVADLNGDHRDDVILGGTPKSPARLAVADASGKFTAIDLAALTASPTLDDGPILVFDADGDGTLDLLVTRSGVALPAGSPDYQPRLLLGSADGALRLAPADTLPPLPLSVGAVAAVDFDRDGRPDLFLGGRVLPGKYPLPPRSALLRNHNGRFEDVTDVLAPALREVGLVTSALWSDVDQDGWPDLLVACEWGPVRCFHNDQGRGFSDWSDRLGFASAGSGLWSSLAAADFNGDGRLDYAAGNLGLNTPYRADPDHPALLFYGAFEPNAAAPQIIEAYYENDRLYPRLSRAELGVKLPSLLKRFPRTDAFARATLPELLGEDRLAQARRFALTQLQSGVFLSRPDGSYRFQPLPRLAQIAPVQGLAAGDFDGDGFADLYALQNSFAPVSSLGRFDGGLSQLLRGDGHGHFAPVEPAASGLIVPGDAKALVVLDLNQDSAPDFLLSRHDDSTLAFLNHPAPGRHFLRLTLRSSPGHSALGARATLRLRDGSTQSLELAAGSGFLSQSSDLFFGLPGSNPPASLSLTWPNGSTSEHSVINERSLMITAPQ